MNQASVTDIANYQFSEEISVNGQYQNVAIPLSTAFYSPADQAVTLVPASRAGGGGGVVQHVEHGFVS